MQKKGEGKPKKEGVPSSSEQKETPSSYEKGAKIHNRRKSHGESNGFPFKTTALSKGAYY